jgi:hypothetical protein
MLPMKPALCVSVLLAVAAWQGGTERQDPPSLPPIETEKKPAAPLPPAPPPGQERSRLEAAPVVNPFLGVWSVTAAARPGGLVARPTGYIVFTPSFMSLHLAQASPMAAGARQQSSFRRYQVRGINLVTTTVHGLRTDERTGQATSEAGGHIETRRFVFTGPNSLRILQGPEGHLDLTRIEGF